MRIISYPDFLSQDLIEFRIAIHGTKFFETITYVSNHPYKMGLDNQKWLPVNVYRSVARSNIIRC